jgi:hypothetical protein
MNVYQFLLEKAKEQLDAKTASDKGEWFDSFIAKAKDEIQNSGLQDEELQLALDAVSLIASKRSLLEGLGAHAFELLLFQICCGRDEEAIQTYISSLTNADDLIVLMNSGADGVIKAKMELDKLHADGKKLVLDLLTLGVRYALPFLLSLI